MRTLPASDAPGGPEWLRRCPLLTPALRLPRLRCQYLAVRRRADGLAPRESWIPLCWPQRRGRRIRQGGPKVRDERWDDRRFAERHAGGRLGGCGARVLVAFDDHRAGLEDRDVPADTHEPLQSLVRAH